MWENPKSLGLLPRIEIPNRSLEIFRFLLGALIAYDLIVHFSDLSLLYTDQGIFPRALAIPSVTKLWWSIYFLAGSFLSVAILYSIHLILALCFMAGVGLPWVTIALWAFQFSLRNRNVSIMDGSDDLSIVLLFFAVFLPLTPKLQDAKSYFRKWITQPMWHVAFIVQILCLYSFSALQKSDASWNSVFNAISLTLRLDILVNPVGKWLLHFPIFLKVMTASVYWLELAGPMVYLAALFFPHSSKNRWPIRVRQTVCVLFILFHLGLSLTMRLGMFPYLCIIAWVTLFPRLEPEPEPEEEPGQETSLAWRASWIPSLIVSLGVFITVVMMNVRAAVPSFKLPTAVQKIGQTLSLHQNWGMFAPYPALDNYFVLPEGHFSDGTRRPIDSQTFWLQNRHRVKFWLNMDLKRRDFLTGYTRYWCRQYSSIKIPKPLLERVTVTSFHHVAYKDRAGERDYADVLWNQSCK